MKCSLDVEKIVPIYEKNVKVKLQLENKKKELIEREGILVAVGLDGNHCLLGLYGLEIMDLSLDLENKKLIIDEPWYLFYKFWLFLSSFIQNIIMANY